MAFPLPTDKEPIDDQGGRIKPAWYNFLRQIRTDLQTTELAKAYVTFSSAGAATSEHNISSITDTGTGNLTANLATDFASATAFTPVAVGELTALAATFVHVGAKNTGTVQVLSNSTAAAAQDITRYSLACFGDQ